MAIQLSDETKVATHPEKFAMAEGKAVTFIKGEPPTGIRGRKSNPVINEIYYSILTNRNVWAHVNIKIISKQQRTNIVASLYNRAKKDNLNLSTRSMFNDRTKTYDLWVMLTA